jgi:endonuclease/exonuclease/phosphatase family metal-dependent hydrolase
MRNRFHIQQLQILEAGLIGIFFVQALRLLIGLLYSRFASAALVSALDPNSIDRTIPGIVEPSTLTSEISFLVYVLALPLLAILLGRMRWLMLVGVVAVAVGRALMIVDSAISVTMAASLVLGGGLLYLAMLIRSRAQILPYFFIMGFGADQIFRAFGNTADPSILPDYLGIQLILSIIAVISGFITISRRQANDDESAVSENFGLLTILGGIGLAGLMFLQLTLLALPNAVAGRAGVDYTTFVPFVLAATLLPLIPPVRAQARAFISTFDGALRGWLWMLIAALLIVAGTRFQGPVGGAALVMAQFVVSMTWWWLVRPQAEKERNFSGLWLILSTVILGVLLLGDSFTYEYAFVRNLAPEFSSLNTIIPPLLRGFRGMGLGLLLLGVFLVALPMSQVQRRIPWKGGTVVQTLLGLILVAAASIGAAYAARPPLVAGVRNVDNIRVGSYNIHAGFTEFFGYNLEEIARTIERSGANVVLLQEVEKGRVTSFGVDQALWLARRLGMDTRFLPTNEGLQGLAILSNIEIVFDEGRLLTSLGNQTGLQRVQVRPDAGVITLYNTWLGLLLEGAGGPTLEEQEQDQERQLSEIFAIISTDHPGGNLGRIIVGGTFNNTPTSPLIQKMRNTGFVDPLAGLPLEISATLWRTGLRARLDYLWIRPPLLATRAGVIDSHASDHRMVVIELQISRSTP